MSRKLRLPSPAMAVALAALFVALSGTAVAAGVPALAKRALVADNAKKLGGKTSAQLLATANASAKAAAESAASAAASQPGPASTAVGLVSIKTAAGATLGAGSAAPYSISCDPGQKILSAGYSSDNLAFQVVQSNPTSDTSWTIGLANLTDLPAAVSLYAVCLR
ncbi:MAG TPA: hypothetical protein VFR32_03140 [Gaiellaceae bacterium]|nr:hypothetical protein [Gaiellaceae bacterium]